MKRSPILHVVTHSGAANVTFTPSEFTELDAAVAAIEIKGARLPDAVLAYSDVEAPARS